MPDLVPEVPQKSAVRLILRGALLLPMHIVRFRDIDGDQSIVVSGQHALCIAVAGVFQEFKPQACRTRGPLGLYRQLQPQKRVKHAPLRDFQPEPGEAISIAR